MPNNLLQNILSDLRVDLTDHFDSNFSRGAFFGKKWKSRRDGIPTHLNNTGTLRRSIRASISRNAITFSSSTPYSAIHNEGGTITVTTQMKRYFWARYRKTGRKAYKAMALLKGGAKIIYY